MKPALVILAGGEGRRIGGGKPLRLLGGESLLERALARAASWSDLIAVAVRTPAQVGELKATEVLDAPDLAGPLAGLIAGARFADRKGRDFLLTIPADTPFLPDNLSERLQDALGDQAVAIASSGGQMHPVCALWRVKAVLADQSYRQTGRRSLWGMAEQLGFATADWPASPHDPFFNINGPEDLAQAEKMLGG